MRNPFAHEKHYLLRILNLIFLVLYFSAVAAVLLKLGFHVSPDLAGKIEGLFNVALLAGLATLIIRNFVNNAQVIWRVFITDLLFFIFIIFLLLIRWEVFSKEVGLINFFGKSYWLHLTLFFIFLRELTHIRLSVNRQYLNPAQLFIVSFAIVILAGTFLLMLPKATKGGISFLNALFTSTSAVCVTGLAVVDTGSHFTRLGQTIIMFLIQIGGLGIMTFASYFSYFFKGGSSFESQLMLKDISNSDKIGEVVSTFKKVIFITFLIEIIGATIIYSTIENTLVHRGFDKVFFSVFHAVSSFCNAGFSTLSNSLYEEGFRYNYSLHLIIAVLFILGGLGFPIIFNLYRYFKYSIVNRIFGFWKKKKAVHLPWVVNLNSRIIIVTSLFLTVIGTLVFYIFEYDNTLAEHSGWGKIVTAFFGSVTTRSAGFNTIDTSSINFYTLIIVLILMWIGASPASTGGGIKTSTFAIAVLNFVSLARGKEKIEVYNREIAEISLRRAFAIITLSVLVIGTSIFLLSAFEKDKDILSIAFEAFSAFSTVGLSLGITGSLSEPGKWVLIGVMFIGRVSMLSILIAFMRKVKHKNYRYPTEEILIN